MIKKIFLIVIVLFALLSISLSPLWALPQEGAVEFGNTICPVSGEEIKEDEVIKYEYDGVIYNLCCKICLKDFKKDPEKYIKKLEAQREAAEKIEIDKHEHSTDHH